MEIFLTILKYAAGPVLGALIGYLTNWLAVKMLFRPYYPKKIGKWRLPFTPGIIPKRKPALAKAIGKAVGEQLFTKDDLAAAIASDAAKQKIGDFAVSLLHGEDNRTAAELLNKVVPEDKREEMCGKAESFISDKIYSAAIKTDLGGVVANQAVKVVNEKKASLGMLAMFLSDDLISSVADKLSDGVNSYVESNGRQLISKAVKSEIDKALNSPLSSVTQDIDEQVIRNSACSVFETVVKTVLAEISENIDISAVVEAKLNEMDVKDLEKLVLSVMKKELNAIVNLGALIGFILGVIMILVQL